MDAQVEWKMRLDELLRNEPKAVVYTLATSETLTADFGHHQQPRARSVVHRSFVDGKETGVVLLQTTTDIRSAKTSQVSHPPAATGTPDAEIVWWFAGSNVQLRLSCYTYLLPAAGHRWREEFPTDLTGKDEDWERVRVEAFNSLSPFLRASFARPTPGGVLGDPEEAKGWPTELPTLGHDPRVKAAFENFAVVYLEPAAVEMVDLGVVPNTRTLYRRQPLRGWSKASLVP